MDLKNLKKQAYDLMLLNPNSQQYQQVKAYIDDMEKKSNIEETQKIIERIERIRESEPTESFDNDDSEGDSEYVSFDDWADVYGTD